MVMRSHFPIEVEHRNNGEASPEQISFIEGADLCNISSRQHTDTDAYIPGCQIGRSGSTTLAIGGEVDKKGIVSRKHNTKTYSQQQGYGKENNST